VALRRRVGNGSTSRALTEVGRLPALDGTHGRLRAVRPGPDGALYVTTSNGQDDEVLRVSPA